MKLKELLKDIEVLEQTAPDELEIGGVRYDSRAVKPGDVFVAIVGFETDGHKYIDSAVKNGAAAIVCQIRPEGDVPFVRV